MIKRHKTKVIKINNVKIGGKNPIAIQSMTNTSTKDVSRTIRQIKRLESAGCEIVRVAVKDKEDARAIANIKKRISIPIVADIHFDHLLAIEAIENGADKIRINPGNIKNKNHVLKIISKAREYKIPIRIGLNSGSIDGAVKKLEVRTLPAGRQGQKSGSDRQGLFVKTVLSYIEFFEKNRFFDIVISLKSSSVQETISLHKKLADKIKYPLHIGITEAGTFENAIVKSSVGLGALLLSGIGDTLRVSITGDPVQEIKAAQDILQACEIRQFSPNIISCPTCGRTQVDLEKQVKQFEKELFNLTQNLPVRQAGAKPARPCLPTGKTAGGRKTCPSGRRAQNAISGITIAIMGCEVNGPGEAKHADIGIAFGKGQGVIFKKGKFVSKVTEKDAVKKLIKEIKKMI